MDRGGPFRIGFLRRARGGGGPPPAGDRSAPPGALGGMERGAYGGARPDDPPRGGARTSPPPRHPSVGGDQRGRGGGHGSVRGGSASVRERGPREDRQRDAASRCRGPGGLLGDLLEGWSLEAGLRPALVSVRSESRWRRRG